MRALSGFYSFVHFLLSEGDSKSAPGKKKVCVCSCACGHVCQMGWSGKSLFPTPAPSYLVSDFPSSIQEYFEFLPRQWSSLGEESKNLKDRGGKSALALLHSHQLWWINEKCGPRQEQHEMVMGSLCSQNATRAIHALWGKVAAVRWEKVNIHFLLKENQCTSIPLSQVKMSIFTLPVWKHLNFL